MLITNRNKALLPPPPKKNTINVNFRQGSLMGESMLIWENLLPFTFFLSSRSNTEPCYNSIYKCKKTLIPVLFFRITSCFYGPLRGCRNSIVSSICLRAIAIRSNLNHFFPKNDFKICEIIYYTPYYFFSIYNL